MLKKVEDIQSEDEEETQLLLEMAAGARAYIASFSWCPPISVMYFAYGVGGVVAVFLVEFEEKIADTDDRLWVISGDLPDAYIVVEPDDSVREALERYCGLMEEWADEVIHQGDFSEVYPVKARRTVENAELLRRRTRFVREDIIPQISESLTDR